ncbi:branched-chain amino acid transport system II carrier protein, partial [Streptococcus mitis]|nr:branched-chain amino acid transport system II carrier protein [Streptococcus mitis]
LFIYGSLLWLGATASTIYSPDIERTQLLIAIVEQTIGGAGKIILSFAITLACLTTATGLLASVANFTQELTRQKYP